MKDDFLLDKGFGIAINPKENSVDWGVFLWRHSKPTFKQRVLTKTDNIELQNEEILKKDEQVLLAQPSEAYLPRQTRQVLKLFYKASELKDQKL